MMETHFDQLVKQLYEEVNAAMQVYGKANHKLKLLVPKNFERNFFRLVDGVNFSLMQEKDNFYGYFLFQMTKEIRFDISSPTAVNFKRAKYVIYFNPLIFLNLNARQMESTIKHEILHVLSMHLTRAREFIARYTPLAINMAMDLVVNGYLDHLPPYAVTLEKVNLEYSLQLELYKPFEYYLEKIQTALDLLEVEDKQKNDISEEQTVKTDYCPLQTHDLWRESNELYDEKTMKEFALKAIRSSEKADVPVYLEGMISLLKNSSELPWKLYLSRLMGIVESNRKKTITRRNRRQPDRLELRGELRSHKAKIAVALDISGSINGEEFRQAIKEVLQIVRNYNHEILIIECDDDIRRVYKLRSEKELKDRIDAAGGTRFSPVFDYANHNGINLLVYFTDGQGEDKLLVKPRGYQVLWVISGAGDQLSVKNPYGPVKKLSRIEKKDKELDLKDVLRDGFSMNHQE